jgi:hypothetical protein
MPSAKAIEQFKELFFQRYGVLLSDAEALEQSGLLLRLYKAIYGPIVTSSDQRDENNRH